MGLEYLHGGVQSQLMSKLRKIKSWRESMTPSYIPVVCLECGANISRKTNKNPRLVCTSCPAEFVMVRIKNGNK